MADWGGLEHLVQRFSEDARFAEQLARHRQYAQNNQWDPQYDY